MEGLDRVLANLIRQRAASPTSESTSDGEGLCPLCGGTGYIPYVNEQTGERMFRECKCERVRENERRIRRSGLQSVLERYTMESYVQREKWQQGAFKAALRYISDRDGSWFFIGGSSGTGKTHLCTAICGKLMEAGVPVLYMQWRSDVPAIKAQINDAEAYERAVRRLKHVRCLYIDDFLKGQPTEGDRNVAYDILNYRYNNPGKMTIISTERSIQEILEWDEAIGGRIVERCGDYLVNIGKKDNWRLK